MPTSVGPNTFGEENLVFGYDTGDTANSFAGIPAVNCAPVPTSKGNWSVTEITDGSIAPPRKGARVFKFVAGTTSNLYRHSGYYGGGGFTNNNNVNPLILGKTSPSNFTTVSEANKYRWGFWVRGVESNNAGWNFYIDIGDRRSASYTVGNKTDWYFISCVNDLGIASTTYPYDFFDIFTANQGLTLYVADMGIMRSPGTVDDLPIMQAYPQWVDYGQERAYTEGLKDLTGNSTIDLTNVSFDSNAQMTFDGTSDYVDLGSPSVLDLSTMTQEVVYQPLGINRRNPIIGDSNPTGSDSAHAMWLEHYDNNKLILVFGDGSTYGDVFSTATITDTTKYHHIVCVRDASAKTVEYFINGVSDGVKDWANKSTIGTPIVYDGSFNNNNYNHYIGASLFSKSYSNIPYVKIYNRALTTSEIKSNYNAIKGRFNI